MRVLGTVRIGDKIYKRVRVFDPRLRRWVVKLIPAGTVRPKTPKTKKKKAKKEIEETEEVPTELEVLEAIEEEKVKIRRWLYSLGEKALTISGKDDLDLPAWGYMTGIDVFIEMKVSNESGSAQTIHTDALYNIIDKIILTIDGTDIIRIKPILYKFFNVFELATPYYQPYTSINNGETLTLRDVIRIPFTPATKYDFPPENLMWRTNAVVNLKEAKNKRISFHTNGSEVLNNSNVTLDSITVKTFIYAIDGAEEELKEMPKPYADIDQITIEAIKEHAWKLPKDWQIWSAGLLVRSGYDRQAFDYIIFRDRKKSREVLNLDATNYQLWMMQNTGINFATFNLDLTGVAYLPIAFFNELDLIDDNEYEVVIRPNISSGYLDIQYFGINWAKEKEKE